MYHISKKTPAENEDLIVKLFNGSTKHAFYMSGEFYCSFHLLPIPKNNRVEYWCYLDKDSNSYYLD